MANHAITVVVMAAFATSGVYAGFDLFDCFLITGFQCARVAR